ncbi:response regulator [Flavobacterium noncentrifugens]|uniref:Response regulator receiver domain-containing protein n=1 Tax=Flavobacterium noncentrifugens TaxID=1128970 RepID=A0A1G8WF64_9FLAO|nr:response regulator [Flavobacterium noncentrifugens]GEP50902.1 response regulator [Flavobacterium noncentrifugens]SDJ76914.1 Response regulator receiver domain-containing protein [Flavobacterium noncentrifugens]
MITHKDPIQIFLADDDEDDRNFFSEAITELKMENRVTTFKDGKDLMDYLEKPDSRLPHILFLDLNMPCKTGFDCLKEIRANSRFKDISIAIYSTSSSEKDIEETFVGGANIYIKKPNDFSKLKKVIKDVVNINWQFHSSGLNKETFFFSI